MDQSTMPRYDAYKSTGVQWLGEIPQHWELKKNKFLFTEQKATVGKKSADFTLLSLTLKGVIARDMENPQGKFPAEFNTYKIVKPDDLIFCLFDIEETPRTIGRATQSGMITGAYDVMECHPDVSARYLSYYYLSLDYDKRLKPLYTGLRKVIQRDTFMGIKTPVPPRVEQDRIANFLDQKTAEIDEAIAKKQRLIELLKEQKAILINQAVTKGLNPDVPMRDSGVEWIGEVPEHWETRRLKHLFWEVSARTKTGEEELLSLRMYAGLVPHNDVSDKPITDEELIDYKLIEPGQMVMNRMRASIGLFGFSSSYGLVSPDYAVFDAHKDVDPEYFLALFKTAEMGRVFRLNSRGLGTGSSGFMRLYTDSFGKISVPFPPIDEQKEIGSRLKEIHRSYAQAEAEVEKEIELLSEMKAVIIAEAVTGKIKL